LAENACLVIGMRGGFDAVCAAEARTMRHTHAYVCECNVYAKSDLSDQHNRQQQTLNRSAPLGTKNNGAKNNARWASAVCLRAMGGGRTHPPCLDDDINKGVPKGHCSRLQMGGEQLNTKKNAVMPYACCAVC